MFYLSKLLQLSNKFLYFIYKKTQQEYQVKSQQLPIKSTHQTVKLNKIVTMKQQHTHDNTPDWLHYCHSYSTIIKNKSVHPVIMTHSLQSQDSHHLCGHRMPRICLLLNRQAFSTSFSVLARRLAVCSLLSISSRDVTL